MHHYVHQETSFGRQDRTTPCNRQEIKGGWGSSIKPKDRRLSVKRRRVRSNARPAYFTLSILFDLACFCPRPVKRLTTSRNDKINPMHSQSIIYRNSSTELEATIDYFIMLLYQCRIAASFCFCLSPVSSYDFDTPAIQTQILYVRVIVADGAPLPLII